MTRSLLLLSLTICFLTTGCSEYVPPGRGANMNALGLSPQARRDATDFNMRGAFERQPLAQFPASIAVARIQAPGYDSPTARGVGYGAYSLVTTRDIEKDDQFDRLAKLPMIKGVAPIGRLSLPSSDLRSDVELRQAAAQLQADMLLIYTIDTAFYVRDRAKPLSIVTLGLSPNLQARVTTTASAVLLDTRNGYIYGSAEATCQDTQTAAAWTSKSAVDDLRLKTESNAFEKLVTNFEHLWPTVVHRHASSTQPLARTSPELAPAPSATPAPLTRDESSPPPRGVFYPTTH
jgi:hypothetical protein